MRDLAARVDEVAREEEVIPRRDSQSIAHESARIERQSRSHSARDPVNHPFIVSKINQIRIFEKPLALAPLEHPH